MAWDPDSVRAYKAAHPEATPAEIGVLASLKSTTVKMILMFLPKKETK